MPDRRRGFTLVEMMIVLTVVGILATLVVANLVSSKSAAHESAVISTLRTLTTAQAQFRQGARVDTNEDGTGEYGGFVELSGRAAGRMASLLVPAVLSSAFRDLNLQGEASTSGYLFRIYLPDDAGAGVGEPQLGFAPGSDVDPEAAAVTWCCYAWPTDHGGSGQRTYMVNQSGEVVSTDAAAYSGSGNGPAPDAGFTTPGTITGALALGVPGQDGYIWNAVR